MQRLTFYGILRAAALLVAVFFVLSGPLQARGQASYRLYVARFMDADIIILDSATGEETGSIELGYGTNPADMLLSLDKKTLYVSNRGTDDLSVIKLSSGKVKRRVKTGLHPHFMKFTPDGKYLIVVNNQDSKATILKTSNLKLAGQPRIDYGASGVAVTGDSRFAYISSIYDNNISVIDLLKMERVLTIPSIGPIAIIIPPGSNLAYFCSHRDRVSILDTKTNKVIGEIPVGDTPNHTTLSRDNRLLFVTNGLSDTLSVIDIKEKRNIKEISVGDEPVSSTLSPDGELLFVVNYGGKRGKGSISVIDVKELNEIERIKFYRYPRAVAVLPAK